MCFVYADFCRGRGSRELAQEIYPEISPAPLGSQPHPIPSNGSLFSDPIVLLFLNVMSFMSGIIQFMIFFLISSTLILYLFLVSLADAKYALELLILAENVKSSH